MIHIICNGEKKRIEPGTLLIDFITKLQLNPETVVAECDGRILKRDDYDTFKLKDGAVLELIRFVGGG